MKNISFALAVVLLMACNETKQPAPAEKTQDIVIVKNDNSPLVTADSSEDPIAFIKNRVERINTMPLQKKHYEFVCDEKMMVDYFYDKGEIVKIAVDFGTVGDSYAKEGYYYDKGQLIFKYEFVEGGPACEGCITTNEYRSYITDDKVIMYLKNTDKAECRKCGFPASSREYKLLKATNTAEVNALFCKRDQGKAMN